ncbi:MAG: VOC family protein [Actinomycetota bacterium]
MGAVTGIHHVQLAMPEGREDEAVAFYEGFLGLAQVPKPEPLAERGGRWFRSGDAEVHVGVEREFRPARKAHPGLLVEGLPQLRSRLAAAGVAVAEDASLPGFDRCYVEDPFGNRIELLEPLSTKPR